MCESVVANTITTASKVTIDPLHILIYIAWPFPMNHAHDICAGCTYLSQTPLPYIT